MGSRYVLIGCGGIGYALAEPAIRYAAVSDPGSEVVLVDGDSVEVGNMERQFFQGAVGQSKSKVLADVYSERFGDRVDVTSLPLFVNPDNISAHKQAWLNNDKDLCVFVCVDNNASRAYIEDQVWPLKNFVLIMGGNDDAAGQAQICMKRKGKEIFPRITSFAPDIRINDGKLPGMGTCMRSSGTQTALANRGAAYAMEILLHGSVKKPLPRVNEIRVTTEGLMKGFWMEPVIS